MKARLMRILVIAISLGAIGTMSVRADPAGTAGTSATTVDSQTQGNGPRTAVQAPADTSASSNPLSGCCG
jgi:hypothetical protein